MSDAVGSSDSLAGVPDAFQRLWTPHRMLYITGENKPTDPSASACPFCRAPGQSDADALIVHRGETCYVVLNLYPYNPGHLLVLPYRHVPDYNDLDAGETAVVALGATKAEFQPGTTFRVFLDPAGHPFCLCVS